MAACGFGSLVKASSSFRMAPLAPVHFRPVPRRCLFAVLATGQHSKPRGVQSRKSASNRRTLTSAPGLRAVPGIGPKNEQLLRAKGIDSISMLNSVFASQFDRDVERLAEYLRQEIGIRHKVHCASIASYVAANGKERVTFSVEGNISAGKSTFLNNLLEEPMELRDLVEVGTQHTTLTSSGGLDFSNRQLDVEKTYQSMCLFPGFICSTVSFSSGMLSMGRNSV